MRIKSKHLFGTLIAMLTVVLPLTAMSKPLPSA